MNGSETVREAKATVLTAGIEDDVDVQKTGHGLACWCWICSFRVGWVGLKQGTNDVEKRAHAERGCEK